MLILAIDDHGFEFPSISDINAAVAVKGLHRDLNHKLLSIRSTAQITLQDWTCQYNKCTSPLMTEGLEVRPYSDLNPLKDKIPSGWLTAVAYMKEMKLSFVQSDQSYVMEEKVSGKHLTVRAKTLRLPLPGVPKTEGWLMDHQDWTIIQDTLSTTIPSRQNAYRNQQICPARPPRPERQPRPEK